MRTIILSTALMFALPLAAQTAKPKPPAAVKASPAAARQAPYIQAPPAQVASTPVAPAISDKTLKDFFKAQSRMMVLTEQSKSANTELQTVISEMQKTCGADATLQINQSGDPTCVLKPAEKK
jgi:L-lactate utilization protein LutC